MWFILSTLVINLWLEHALVLICNPIVKGHFLVGLNRIFSVLEEISKLSVNRLHLSVAETEWLSIDQTLDGSQLLKNQNVLIGLVQVDVSQIGVYQVLIKYLISPIGRF